MTIPGNLRITYTRGHMSNHTISKLLQMTCFVDRVLSGAGMMLHTSLLGTIFCIHLGTKDANFHEKIFAKITGKKLQTFHCSNVL